jgi:hypothetical protein
MALAAGDLPTSPGTAHDARPSLLVRYGTLVDVRHAIDELEAHGVDGDQLALVGEPAAHLAGSTDRRRADSRFLSNATLAIAVGVIGGAVLGALLGAALVGILLLLWSGLSDPGWVFLLLTGWFAAGSAVLGAFAAISRSIGFSESWPLTFEDEPSGPLWLAVYADASAAADVVPSTHPLEIVREPGARTAHPDTADRER